MRFLISLAVAAVCSAAPVRLTFQIAGGEPGSWPAILGSVGLQGGPEESADVLVLRGGSTASPRLAERVEKGAILIVEGQSLAAEMFGFRAAKGHVRVRNVEESTHPQLPIIWENEVELPRFEVPQEAMIFARERWTRAPLVAGLRRGSGAVLWIATDPGARGYERFPYVVHALGELGLRAPFRAGGLWAFFDSSYRLRADPEYLAKRWRAAGIGALHVAAWHYYEPDPARDEYLKRLIELCHRNAILVYAWLELPHVSEKFWESHPEWREKTADLRDAHLDWRKLMNLAHPQCKSAVQSGIKDLIARFDWDGVNLAELYFESLEGAGNPSRFTPMNETIRAEFRAAHQIDPIELFRQPAADQAAMRKFLDYRAGLAGRMQQEWIEFLQAFRTQRPDLDLVLTHVDDHLDTSMRDAIGADSAAIAPVLRNRRVTFMIEDPATVWHLGPARYKELARRYSDLALEGSRLALDINVVERYQNVYPTKQQTGTELLLLVRAAAESFARTALYFESSILPRDVAWLSAAAAVVDRAHSTGSGVLVECRRPIFVQWSGPALVNGVPWPLGNQDGLLLPPGTHRIAPAESGERLITDLTAGTFAVRSAGPNELEIEYESESRAMAVVSSRISQAQVDGAPAVPIENGTVRIPAGRHVVRFRLAPVGVHGW